MAAVIITVSRRTARQATAAAATGGAVALGASAGAAGFVTGAPLPEVYSLSLSLSTLHIYV